MITIKSLDQIDLKKLDDKYIIFLDWDDTIANKKGIIELNATKKLFQTMKNKNISWYILTSRLQNYMKNNFDLHVCDIYDNNEAFDYMQTTIMGRSRWIPENDRENLCPFKRGSSSSQMGKWQDASSFGFKYTLSQIGVDLIQFNDEQNNCYYRILYEGSCVGVYYKNVIFADEQDKGKAIIGFMSEDNKYQQGYIPILIDDKVSNLIQAIDDSEKYNKPLITYNINRN